MEHDFWHARWEGNRIAFHEGSENALISAHFSKLQLAPRSKIFVPLCGKTRDIAWLLSQGHSVIGAELSELAISQLFSELGVSPKITDLADHKHYHAPHLDIYVGDIFALTSEMIGPVEAIIDRAALVALPSDMRGDYAAQLTSLTAKAPQLLVTYEYDQSAAKGPPFSVSANEVRSLYENDYAIALLKTVSVEGGLRGTTPATETIWQLTPF
ncbi:thiopurine S-methyltransferase [Yoonia maritima]|uniref:thiopurine S-methyltransferase n=1 Tax=Yoonia maritima TaxID=1435347 RepID=UPI0037355435